jgi:polyvinyl alcohol dehydrogenase (cytochrome)
MSTRRILRSLDTGTMMMPGRRLTPEGRQAVAEFLTGKALRDDPPPEDSGYCAESTDGWPSGGPEWNGWSPDHSNRRFQAEPGFTAADLPKLKLRWAFGFDGDVVSFGHPTVFGGRVFAGSAGGHVYALDAESGCIRWRFVAETGVRTAPVIGRTGTRHTVWFGDLRSNLYALDAETGDLLWRKRMDPHPVARITAAPALHEGRLYVPVSSFEEGMGSDAAYECCTFRGSLIALDAGSGRQIWQAWMIAAPARPTRKNKAGTQMRGPSGAAIWSTPTVDPARGVVYVTTGDNYTEPATSLSDAVVALRLRDGGVAWSRQLTPNDVWNAACMGDRINCPEPEGPDADFGSPAILAKTPSGRELLIAAQKSGVVYGLDPDRRGATVWQTRAGKGGLLGGIQWGHAVDGEKVYAPISDMVIPEAAITGGGLAALRLSDGEQVWRAAPASCGERRPCSPAQMAAATVIPGVVFSGARDGILRAYSSSTGRVIWQFDTARPFDTINKVAARGGAIDGPGPVVANGLLLVNSGYAYWGGAPGNVLLAFGAD